MIHLIGLTVEESLGSHNLVVLVVCLKQDCRLGPDEGNGRLEIQGRLLSETAKLGANSGHEVLVRSDGAVDQTVLGIRPGRDIEIAVAALEMSESFPHPIWKGLTGKQPPGMRQDQLCYNDRSSLQRFRAHCRRRMSCR